MLAVRLDPRLEAHLAAVARIQRKSKSEVVRDAVVRMLEDLEDVELATAALASTRKRKSLRKLRKELGLDR